MRVFVASLFLAFSLVPGIKAAPARAADLAAHRAVYTLSLNNARGGDVTGATGTMNYEVADACDGWATHQRLDLTITNRDGQDIQMVSEYTTWESKDGLRLRFHMKQTTDTAVSDEIDGDAHLDRTGGPGIIHYVLPQDATKPLPPGTLFPMAHTAMILASAADGKKFIALPLFDGTGSDGAQDSSVAITSWVPPAANRYAPLAALPSGRVHVAFFDRSKNSQQPDYEVGMRYFANGVADDLQMDFGDFVIDGRLTQFAILPPHC